MAHDALAPLIICFGDSLTAGYQSPRPGNPEMLETPYGAFLQERLGPRARVAVSGICGELTGEMAMRFRADVLAHKPAAVVILGGTNDLGLQARPGDIMRNLLKMYELALAGGIRPVAVTVPSIRLAGDMGDREAARWFDEHVERRQELNGLIRNYCTSKRVPCVDLFSVTAEPETLRLAAPYSNDGLHLTTEGYRLLATRLYEEVFAHDLPGGDPSVHRNRQS
jgi:lysophospholipase L1-like esterase